MIIGSAVRDRGSGEVYWLPRPARHHSVIHSLVKLRRWQTARNGEQGFVTESGEFLDRRRGMLHAIQFEQLLNPPELGRLGNGEILYSEDLW